MYQNPGADRIWQIADEFGLEAVVQRIISTPKYQHSLVQAWILENNMDVYWATRISDRDFWFLPNTDQRIVFKLRWS
jgi:hypothetical protein